MNLKLNEIENWYQTLSGKINSELIIRSIKNFFNTSPEKNILYFGPEAIIKKLLRIIIILIVSTYHLLSAEIWQQTYKNYLLKIHLLIILY